MTGNAATDGRRILVVDDERFNTQLVRRALLPRKTYRVIEAQSGEEALSLLTNDQVDLLIVDYRMPGMTGVEFIEKVRASGLKIPAIMSTASATLLAPSTTFVENILRNIRPGMSDVVTLRAMRMTVLVFTGLVLLYAMTVQGSSIYELVSGAYQDLGAFKTPTLRNIAKTAPYGHDGSLAKLEDVVTFYNNGGRVKETDPFPPYLDGGIRPLNLSKEQEADLVEFLKTLTSPEYEKD